MANNYPDPVFQPSNSQYGSEDNPYVYGADNYPINPGQLKSAANPNATNPALQNQNQSTFNTNDPKSGVNPLKDFDYTKPQAPNLTPDANNAQNKGNSQVATPGGNPSKQGIPQRAIGSPDTANSTPAPSNTNAPLALYGNTPQTQAKMLDDWLKSNGADPGKIVVGGHSQYDNGPGSINELIDKVNNPNTTDAERKMYATQLSSLIKLRNASSTGALFTYNNGQYDAPPGAPGTQTPNDLIHTIGQPAPQPNTNWRPDGTAIPTGAVNADASRASSLSAIENLQNTGTLADTESRLRTSSLINGIESGAATRQQQHANQLASQGVQGGVAIDQLGQDIRQAGSDRAAGLTSINTSILNRQQDAKLQAVSALLQQQGLDKSSADAEASRLLQGQIAQAQLAQGGEQFKQQMNYNGDYATTAFKLQQRQQDLTSAIQLMQLAQNGDTSAAQRALELLLHLS